jgi:hypothetical protein
VVFVVVLSSDVLLFILVVLFNSDFLSFINIGMMRLLVIIFTIFILLVFFLNNFICNLILVVQTTSFLNFALTSFIITLARREVSSGQVKTIKVFGTHKKVSLFSTQMLVRIHSCLLQNINVTL